MANTIVTKNSSTASAVPTAADLVQGELAVNVTDKRLFTENSGGTVVELGTNPSTLAVAGNATVGGTLGVTGATTLAGASVTSLTNSGSTTLSGGTANGVAYLNGSKVLTSGSALTFDGTNLSTTGTMTAGGKYTLGGWTAIRDNGTVLEVGPGAAQSGGWTSTAFFIAQSEQMRLTSTGLGIGTSSPTVKLDVAGAISATAQLTVNTADGANQLRFQTAGVTKWVNYTQSSGLRWYNGTSDVLTLDSSGNLGLGVTPSAWSTNWKAFDVGAVTSFAGSTTTANILGNAYNNTSGTWIYKTTAAATRYSTGVGQHTWYTAPSGTAGNAISFTQAMTLDASGNLLVGTTTASAKLTVNNTTDNSTVAIFHAGGGTPNRGLKISTFSSTNNNAGVLLDAQTTVGGAALAFATAGTERARIDSSGNLLVGTTSSAGTLTTMRYDGGSGVLALDRTAGSDGPAQILQRNGTQVGSISVSTSATSYNTSSDYRLKEDWVAISDASTRVNALKPVNFAWKVDGKRVDGFLAHELAEVVPEAVTGEKDAVDADGNPVYQGIDQSKLVPLLTAALQEALAEINSLKARLDAANL